MKPSGLQALIWEQATIEEEDHAPSPGARITPRWHEKNDGDRDDYSSKRKIEIGDNMPFCKPEGLACNSDVCYLPAPKDGLRKNGAGEEADGHESEASFVAVVGLPKLPSSSSAT